ncbi:hypothetical protein COCCADRAFT_4984 [Bipolaris zeicola 26-R-13]|uniref:Rhodopsin domain-containing protein n=1 Tax=Cochliobolus carbonum (strain 26-R-13) TaxID=930089 RepID=W6Y172_COCC2|nr:uncharacterized protein COCCADRAFT_4984 [Bipolaris zeicola 26-R-13]EUC33507.1 hypothetical protein COCCADRAFT_4984 [Bipolaris zeicola 26-R-13]
MDFSSIPAGVPPPGITPNLSNPADRLKTVIIASAFIQVITFVFIAIRVYVNVWMRKVCLEDVFLYIAWCAFVAQTSLTIHAGTTGVMRHLWDMNLAVLLDGSYHYNNTVICYTISGGFAKAAVFLQLKKILTTQLRGAVYWVIMVSLVANAIAYTVLLFLYIFNCWPLEKMRNPLLPGHCLNWQPSVIAIGVVNLVSDIEALCVPIWAIWTLSLELKRKFQIFAVFAVALLAVAIASLGLYFRVLTARRYDYTWHLPQSAIVNIAELGTVIVVGCFPALARILSHAKRKAAPPPPRYFHSVVRNKARPRKDTLNDSHDSAGQESNSIVMLETYGYNNSIVDHRGSEVSFGGENDVHAISSPIVSTADMTV